MLGVSPSICFVSVLQWTIQVGCVRLELADFRSDKKVAASYRGSAGSEANKEKIVLEGQALSRDEQQSGELHKDDPHDFLGRQVLGIDRRVTLAKLIGRGAHGLTFGDADSTLVIKIAHQPRWNREAAHEWFMYKEFDRAGVRVPKVYSEPDSDNPAECLTSSCSMKSYISSKSRKDRWDVLIMDLVPGKSFSDILNFELYLTPQYPSWTAIVEKRWVETAISEMVDNYMRLVTAQLVNKDQQDKNIMLEPSGHVTFIDLGSAKRLEDMKGFDAWKFDVEFMLCGFEVFESDKFDQGAALFKIVSDKIEDFRQELGKQSTAWEMLNIDKKTYITAVADMFIAKAREVADS